MAFMILAMFTPFLFLTIPSAASLASPRMLLLVVHTLGRNGLLIFRVGHTTNDVATSYAPVRAQASYCISS